MIPNASKLHTTSEIINASHNNTTASSGRRKFTKLEGAENPFNGIKINGTEASPWCGDLLADDGGLFECVVGQQKGGLLILKNVGNRTFPKFEYAERETSQAGLHSVLQSKYSTRPWFVGMDPLQHHVDHVPHTVCVCQIWIETGI